MAGSSYKVWKALTVCTLLLRLLILVFAALAYSTKSSDHVHIVIGRELKVGQQLDAESSSNLDDGKVDCYVFEYSVDNSVELGAKLASYRESLLNFSVGSKDSCKGAGICGTPCMAEDYLSAQPECPCLPRPESNGSPLEGVSILGAVVFTLLGLTKLFFFVCELNGKKWWITESKVCYGKYAKLHNSILTPMMKYWILSLMPAITLEPLTSMKVDYSRSADKATAIASATQARTALFVVLLSPLLILAYFIIFALCRASQATANACSCSFIELISLLVPWLLPLVGLLSYLVHFLQDVSFPPAFHFELAFDLKIGFSFQAYVDLVQLGFCFMFFVDSVAGMLACTVNELDGQKDEVEKFSIQPFGVTPNHRDDDDDDDDVELK